MLVFLPFDLIILLGDNAVDKLHYLACIQHDNQNSVAYGCQAATRIFIVTELQYLTVYKKKSFQPICIFESRREHKIKSGNFIPMSTFITSMLGC